ncbi:hypothetical protein DPEC_G00084270 [Dallia pectoralis]|uniref:Uncharacterized protein n=1 Tax=Dallia pectoralis TaxID=75939 RepID=A0ACC2GZC1_DALPE|nr:hypothetical protein DPEC_G00084270 [Dallia pectoralis]
MCFTFSSSKQQAYELTPDPHPTQPQEWAVALRSHKAVQEGALSPDAIRQFSAIRGEEHYNRTCLTPDLSCSLSSPVLSTPTTSDNLWENVTTGGSNPLSGGWLDAHRPPDHPHVQRHFTHSARGNTGRGSCDCRGPGLENTCHQRACQSTRASEAVHTENHKETHRERGAHETSQTTSHCGLSHLAQQKDITRLE